MKRLWLYKVKLALCLHNVIFKSLCILCESYFVYHLHTREYVRIIITFSLEEELWEKAAYLSALLMQKHSVLTEPYAVQ